MVVRQNNRLLILDSDKVANYKMILRVVNNKPIYHITGNISGRRNK